MNIHIKSLNFLILPVELDNLFDTYLDISINILIQKNEKINRGHRFILLIFLDLNFLLDDDLDKLL